jgi:iron complex transport system ATP-binding protein
MIICQTLSYTVGSKQILRNIDLRLDAGKVHVLLGANGAGKSTLLKCLSKDLQPSNGQIVWQGQPLEALSFEFLAQQRAVLSQKVQLNFGFKVAEVIQLGLAVNSPQKQPGLVKIARFFDLEHLLNQNYLTLSGGEQQRTQLARVVAQLGEMTAENLQGKWLLLDEWNTGLDLKHLQTIQLVLQDYVALGLGVLMVVHDLNLAVRLADQCHLLKAGSLVASGSPKTVLTPKLLAEVFGVQAKWLSVLDEDVTVQWIYVD